MPNRLTYHNYHPYNTNHSCHTYHTYQTYNTLQTCHTRPTIHTIHTQHTIPHPQHTTGGEGDSTTPPPHHRGGGEDLIWAVYGTHPMGGEGRWQGLVHKYTFRIRRTQTPHRTTRRQAAMPSCAVSGYPHQPAWSIAITQQSPKLWEPLY